MSHPVTESKSAELRRTVFPPELLYDIVGDVVAEYIDYAIMGSIVGNPNATAEDMPSASTLVSLLQTSYQFRDVSLQVLSDILGIERDNVHGLASNPWAPIRITRAMVIMACHRVVGVETFNTIYQNRRVELRSQTLKSPLIYAYHMLTPALFFLRAGVKHIPFGWSDDDYTDLLWKYCQWCMKWDKVKQGVFKERIAERSARLMGKLALSLHFNQKAHNFFSILNTFEAIQHIDTLEGYDTRFSDHPPLLPYEDDASEDATDEGIQLLQSGNSFESVESRKRLWNLSMQTLYSELGMLSTLDPNRDLLTICFIKDSTGDFCVEVTRDVLLDSNILDAVKCLWELEDEKQIMQAVDALLEHWSPPLTEQDKVLSDDSDEDDSGSVWGTDDDDGSMDIH